MKTTLSLPSFIVSYFKWVITTSSLHGRGIKRVYYNIGQHYKYNIYYIVFICFEVPQEKFRHLEQNSISCLKIWKHVLSPLLTNLGHGPVTYLAVLYNLKNVDPNIHLSQVFSRSS